MLSFDDDKMHRRIYNLLRQCQKEAHRSHGGRWTAELQSARMGSLFFGAVTNRNNFSTWYSVESLLMIWHMAWLRFDVLSRKGLFSVSTARRIYRIGPRMNKKYSSSNPQQEHEAYFLGNVEKIRVRTLCQGRPLHTLNPTGIPVYPVYGIL